MGRPQKPPRLVRLAGKGKNLYIIHGRKTISVGTEDLRVGQQKLADYMLRIRGIRVPKEHHEVSVTEILLRYGNHQKQAKRGAAERFKYSLRNLQPFWKSKTAAEVEPETLADYEQHRRQTAGAASGTIKRELTDLRSAINHAVATRTLKPFPKISLLSGGDPRDRWLTNLEVEKLLREARKSSTNYNLVLFIVLGLWSGARKRALLDLKKSQIDFANRILDFNTPGELRTKKRKSRIPLSRSICTLLQERFSKVSDQTEYVFHQKTNSMLKVCDITKGFNAACVRAGLTDVTPHTLRHTCATRMALRGVPLRTAAAYLNMTVTTLERVYTHHAPEHLREISEQNSPSEILPKNNLEQAGTSENPEQGPHLKG
jgi:integrase